MGNPQNLYLYADYELTAEQFFGTMLPLTLVSLAVLTAASLLYCPGPREFRSGFRNRRSFEGRAVWG